MESKYEDGLYRGVNHVSGTEPIPPTESNPLLTRKHLVCKELVSLNAKIYMGLMGKTADYRKLFHARMMKRLVKPYSIWWVGRDSNPRPTD